MGATIDSECRVANDKAHGDNFLELSNLVFIS